MVSLIIFVFIFLFMLCLGIPLIHDFLFDNYNVSNYEEKEGIVSEVKLEEKKESKICENIIVDDYNIFIKCGENYKPQFKVGDKTKYYVYKNNGYHTKDQMKSGTVIGKILDYGMIGSYIFLFILVVLFKDKLSSMVTEISRKKENTN